MKRFSVGLASFLYGLFLTWLCLYVLSHVHRAPSLKPATGCHELGRCPTPWWVGALIVLAVLGPAVCFCALNVYSWNRWSIRKWLIRFSLLNVLTVALYGLLAA